MYVGLNVYLSTKLVEVLICSYYYTQIHRIIGKANTVAHKKFI